MKGTIMRGLLVILAAPTVLWLAPAGAAACELDGLPGMGGHGVQRYNPFAHALRTLVPQNGDQEMTPLARRLAQQPPKTESAPGETADQKGEEENAKSQPKERESKAQP